jgi:YgiT-type zinc finger domain-containing protein
MPAKFFLEKNMECDCGGVLLDGKSSYRTSKDNFTFIFENIPAYKCMRCDRVLFTDETVKKIQKLVKHIERETTEIITGRSSVNLYEY